MQFVTRDQTDIEKKEKVSIFDGLVVLIEDKRLEVLENNGQVTLGRANKDGYQNTTLTYNQLESVIEHILAQSEAPAQPTTAKLKKDKGVKNV